MAQASSYKKQARVLAIANQKGGVGKTTSSVSLGAAFSRMGKKVLIIDMDPHACASVHLRYYPDSVENTTHDFFIEENPDYNKIWDSVRQHNGANDLDVVVASIRLSELEADLRNRQGKGAIIQKALAHVRGEYDYIILDCPPHVGILLVNALVASDLLIIPIQTDFLALHGLKLIFDTIKILNKVLPEPICYRVLPTLYDKRAKACARVLELIKLKMRHSMFNTVISMDTRFRDASALGKVIYEIDPESRGAIAYAELAREIESL